ARGGSIVMGFRNKEEVLEQAKNVALSFKHREVRNEHLLVLLLDQPAVRGRLAGAGGDPDDIKRRLIKALEVDSTIPRFENDPEEITAPVNYNEGTVRIVQSAAARTPTNDIDSKNILDLLL